MHHGGLGVKRHFGTLYTVYIVVLTIKTLNLESPKGHNTFSKSTEHMLTG